MAPTASIPSDPTRPVVIYDGECAFCRRQVERIRRGDTQGVFTCIARQTPGLDDRFPALRDTDFEAGMRLVDVDGSITLGADAAYRIARHLRPWRRLAWIYRIPGLRSVFRLAYAWVARNRHRLGRP